MNVLNFITSLFILTGVVVLVNLAYEKFVELVDKFQRTFDDFHSVLDMDDVLTIKNIDNSCVVVIKTYKGKFIKMFDDVRFELIKLADGRIVVLDESHVVAEYNPETHNAYIWSV